MSDLIERLRDRYSKHSQELRDEAAAEIERLEEGVLYLEAVISNQDTIMTDRMEPVIDAARDVIEHQYCDDGYRNISIPEGVERRLREALDEYDRSKES